MLGIHSAGGRGMLALQISLSAAGAALTLPVVALLLRDAHRHLVARIGAALLTCSLGYSLILMSEVTRVSMPLLQAAIVLNAFALGLNWLFGHALLRPGFGIGRMHWTAFVVLSLVMLAAEGDVFGYRGSVRSMEKVAFVVSLAVMGHILWIALSGFSDDLVNRRRLVRIWFVLFVLATYGILMVLNAVGASAAWRSIVYDTTTVVVSISILMWASQLRPEQITLQSRPLTVPAPDDEARLRLIEVMESAHAYREPGLGIGALARRVGLTEHRLRALINGALGYGNFAEFLNHYRLADAAAALGDPEQSGKSIFVIAMDSGYSSLSAFNRAFKARFGETPTSYRSRHAAPSASVSPR
jgi:AraC-like DNA-binding protein